MAFAADHFIDCDKRYHFKPQQRAIASMKAENAPKKFVKRRDYRGNPNLFKRLRKSKSLREYEAYCAMARHGIPCPGGLRLNDNRNAFGLLNVGELSMDEIKNASDLRFVCLLDEYKALINDPTFRRALVDEIAKWVRIMHENGFYHHNLNFRNVLVVTKPPLPVRIYFIDAASAKINPPSFRLAYNRKKEIAFLYKDARAWFAPKEMMRFLHVYFDCKKLNVKQRIFVKELIEYARKKWGERSSGIDD